MLATTSFPYARWFSAGVLVITTRQIASPGARGGQEASAKPGRVDQPRHDHQPHPRRNKWQQIPWLTDVNDARKAGQGESGRSFCGPCCEPLDEC